VLDTERTVLTVEDKLTLSQADGVKALIQLYKGLGGGWSPASAHPIAAVAAGPSP
jgi:outer membrane protein TolC